MENRIMKKSKTNIQKSKEKYRKTRKIKNSEGNKQK